MNALLVDLDGVVWRGDVAIPGSAEAIRRLRSAAIDLVFVTNDPRASAEQYARRLAHLHIPATEHDVVTCGQSMAAVAANAHRPGAPILVVGTEALKAEFTRAGLTVVTASAAAVAVAVGGHDEFNYAELRAAVQAVHRGAILYAAGRDAVFPMPDGPWPGTGAVVAAIEYATGATAVCAGKPERHIFDLAQVRIPHAEHVAVVGDTLRSDIAGGNAAGLTTILVLSGTTNADSVEKCDVSPDYVFADLAAAASAILTAPERHADSNNADAHSGREQ